MFNSLALINLLDSLTLLNILEALCLLNRICGTQLSDDLKEQNMFDGPGFLYILDDLVFIIIIILDDLVFVFVVCCIKKFLNSIFMF